MYEGKGRMFAEKREEGVKKEVVKGKGFVKRSKGD